MPPLLYKSTLILQDEGLKAHPVHELQLAVGTVICSESFGDGGSGSRSKNSTSFFDSRLDLSTRRTGLNLLHQLFSMGIAVVDWSAFGQASRSVEF